MSKPKIHLFYNLDNILYSLSVDNVTEMDEVIQKIKKEKKDFDVCQIKVVVGDERCVKVINQQASVRYSLTNCGCNCKK